MNKKIANIPVAIIGIGSIFPQARTTQQYWDNILHKLDCVTDVPASRWSVEDYYHVDPSVPDKTYCKRGGFIPDIEFDPMEFGLPPNILEVTDVSQLLSLVVAKEALEDAGYGEDTDFDREHTGCVLGFVGTSSKLFTPLMTRLQYPVWAKVLRSVGLSEPDTVQIIEKMKLAYVNWEENSFPGAIGNVVSGRICNRFDLGGVNCVVDAACASSLAAVKMAVSELVEGRANMMITGGVDTDNSINTYMCFSKTPAFTKKETVRPFDAESGGMMVGEGIGMIVLKRLEDAERDGDRVYAVIRAIGTSSDGRFKSIYAPRPAGQAKALRRAYEEAGFAPGSVGMIEAHGTGTMAGDPAEFEGLVEAFGENNERKQYIALGSVKSQIAHTKAAAGVASLIKASLALYHKILPPTINVDRPHPKLNIENTPFYLNTETRPWIRAHGADPRRAGVSSFGFGGTNFHVVLEEHESEHFDAYRLNNGAQPILLSALDPAQLLAACRTELQQLQGGQAEEHFLDLAQSSLEREIPVHYARLGFVANTPDEALQMLQVCVATLSEKVAEAAWEHPKGIYYRRTGLNTPGKVVALFSGQGSQYLNMGRELALSFPVMREVFASLDDLFIEDGLEPLSSKVFPRPVFSDKEREVQAELLTRTDHAQPAIGAISAAMYKILLQAGFHADFIAGHSFGELTALWAAGVLTDEDYFVLAKARGKAMSPPPDPSFDAGTMVAIKGDVEKMKEILTGDPDITLANWNSNNQIVIAGPKPVMDKAQEKLTSFGFQVIPLPVSAAFHTSLVEHAQKPFAEAIARARFHKPKVRVFSNSTGAAHRENPQEISKALSNHILKPVLFRDEIEAIYAEGGSIFVEFGPKNILTNLVDNILAGKPHLAVALNGSPKKDSDRQLREAVVCLRVAGIPLKNLDPYARLTKPRKMVKKSSVTVNLNGGYYVSEKTRLAFEKALTDGFQIRQPDPGHEPGSKYQHLATDAEESVQSLTVTPGLNNTQPVEDPYRMNTNVSQQYEHILAAYQAHQSDTLRLHEQYLRTEEEYARAFSQVTSLQADLIKKSTGDLQAVLPLFESLERSMVRFHEHQAETLRVHQHYLESQENLAQSILQVTAVPPVISGLPANANPLPPPLDIHSQKPGSGTHPVSGDHRQVAQVQSPKVNGRASGVSVVPAAAHVQVDVERTAVKEGLVPTQANPLTIDVVSLKTALLEIVSEKTGYPVETLELDMDMEADLGIDSIKRVEILGAMQDRFPGLPKIETAVLAEMRTLGQIVNTMGRDSLPDHLPAETGQKVFTAFAPAVEPLEAQSSAPKQNANVEVLIQALLHVVSEKTGYPVETLELDMDMEADLGIDSIKRVEILGAMQDQFPGLPKVESSLLAELRTLGQIVSHMSQVETGSSQTPSAGGTAQPPFDLAYSPLINRDCVVRKLLPKPDNLEFDLPDNHICLITDDGTSVTPMLVEHLVNRGWPVVVLGFPSANYLKTEALPISVPYFQVAQWSEAALQVCLAQVREKHGPVAVFIHLSPTWTVEKQRGLDFPEGEKELIKMVFLTAKHLKPTLTAAAEQGRAAFITVTRLDGEFGLGDGSDFSPVSGGLFGLVKTLNLEWDLVYCRAVDLSPALSPQDAVNNILAELSDPNRLISEVGYTLTERSTLALVPLLA